MLPVSSAYFEPRICASSRMACSPAHASVSAALASAGLSLSEAAAAVSPVASAAKNFAAVGSGPFGFGVHAVTNPRVVTTTAATVSRLAARDAVESHVAIEADVTNPRPQLRGGAPISPKRTNGRKGASGSRQYVDLDEHSPQAELSVTTRPQARAPPEAPPGSTRPSPSVTCAAPQCRSPASDRRGGSRF